MKALFYMVLGIAMCCFFLWCEEGREVERGCTAHLIPADPEAFYASFDDSVKHDVPEADKVQP